MKSINIEKSIVVASTDLFLEYGFKTVTMDDIALNMKISKKTIYNFLIIKALVQKVVFSMYNYITSKLEEIREQAKAIQFLNLRNQNVHHASIEG